jgi:hypothetical protein
VSELPAVRSFRRAEVELFEDVYPLDGEATRTEIQAELCARFQKALPLPKHLKTKGPVHELLAGELPLGVLTDLVSFALPLDAELKCELLAECDVDRRAQWLLGALGAPIKKPAPAASAGFAPPFSRN